IAHVVADPLVELHVIRRSADRPPEIAEVLHEQMAGAVLADLELVAPRVDAAEHAGEPADQEVPLGDVAPGLRPREGARREGLEVPASRKGLRARSSVFSASNHSVVMARLLRHGSRGATSATQRDAPGPSASWPTRPSFIPTSVPREHCHAIMPPNLQCLLTSLGREDTMIKVFAMLRRRPESTREQFHRWWIDEHVPYVTKLPGLRKYRVCL